jgi:hypothetical protein
LRLWPWGRESLRVFELVFVIWCEWGRLFSFLQVVGLVLIFNRCELPKKIINLIIYVYIGLVRFVHRFLKLEPKTEPNHVGFQLVRFFILTINIGFFSVWIGLDCQFNWIFLIRLQPSYNGSEHARIRRCYFERNKLLLWFLNHKKRQINKLIKYKWCIINL